MKLFANEYGQPRKNKIALESIQFEEKIILAELLAIGFTQRLTSIVFFWKYPQLNQQTIISSRMHLPGKHQLQCALLQNRIFGSFYPTFRIKYNSQ